MRLEMKYMSDAFFFDSYAIFEIMKGNLRYEKYTKSRIILTKLNLFEIFYNILKEYGEEKANFYLNKYWEFAIDYDKDVLEAAAKLRLKYKDKKISMTDCIGYMIAKKYGIKFLTGDKEFENLPNVEFMK